MSLRTTLCTALALATMAGSASATTVSAVFGPSYSFSTGAGNLNFSLTGLDTNIAGDLTIDFTVIGDLNSSNENFRLFVDGTNYGRGCDNNTGNDSFGIAGDSCSQSDNAFRDGSLTIGGAAAAAILADGQIDLRFNYTNNVHAGFVDINIGPTVRSGATFTNQNGFSFAAGGTVSYAIAAVPLPAAATMLLAGLGGLVVAGRRRKTG